MITNDILPIGEEPVFEVFDYKNPDKRMKIYANGRIEGFPDGYSNVFNRISQVCHQFFNERMKEIKEKDKGFFPDIYITDEQAKPNTSNDFGFNQGELDKQKIIDSKNILIDELIEQVNKLTDENSLLLSRQNDDYLKGLDIRSDYEAEVIKNLRNTIKRNQKIYQDISDRLLNVYRATSQLASGVFE